MVAFSRITFALAFAGLSTAQSFSVPAPSGLPSDFPSGAFSPGSARPTGGFGGPGGHGGDKSSFADPTGGLHSGGSRPDASDAIVAQSPQQSGGNAPFPTGGFSAFPSGAARPSGHRGHHGKGSKGGSHSGQESGAPAPTAATGLERRQQQSSTPVAFSGGFPAKSGFPVPSDGFPSGEFPAPSGGLPSGKFPESGAPFPTGGDFSAFPSGVAKPSGHRGHGGKGEKGGKGGKHSGKHSGKPSGTALTAAPLTTLGLGRRQKPSGTPPTPSGSFSGPTSSGSSPAGSIPSGVAPPQGARPSGHPSGPHPSGTPPARPSDIQNNIAAAAAKSGPAEKPTGIKPTGARPTGARPSGQLSGVSSEKPSAIPSSLRRRAQYSGSIAPEGSSFTKPAGAKPSGVHPSGTPPSGTPPSGNPPSGSPPSGTPAKFNVAAQSGAPTGARPSGKFSGLAPSSARPTVPPSSGKPSGPASTGFLTSTIRGA